jgi:hypothetical protein
MLMTEVSAQGSRFLPWTLELNADFYEKTET